jgi:hypothetical protein
VPFFEADGKSCDFRFVKLLLIANISFLKVNTGDSDNDWLLSWFLCVIYVMVSGLIELRCRILVRGSFCCLNSFV